MADSGTNKSTFWESKKRQEKLTSWILFLIAWAGAIIFVTPLFWMISTSLKTSDDIFTIPPKWIPISSVKLDYPTRMVSEINGRVNIERGEWGIKVVEILGKSRKKSYVVPEAGKVLIRDGQVVRKGKLVATMPKTGIVKIVEGNPKLDIPTNIQIVGPKGGFLKEFRVPDNTMMKVDEGDRVNVGDKLATIPPQWENYSKAWAPQASFDPDAPTFTRYMLNTIFVTVMGILGVLISSSFVAYGFARFRFPFRDTLFIVLIGTMMIPLQVTMVPTFILFKYFGWIDTFAPLIVPTFFGGGAFNIFLMRQFFMSIPYELDDAAKIDGCNYFQIFTIILLPLVKPALATVAIFGFVYNWNDFLNPLIYLNSAENYTLALGLQTFTTMYGTEYNLMMAASTIVLLPILIVFFAGQRYFIEGVATSGLKG